MRLFPFDMAYPDWGGINERYACAFAQTAQLQEDSHGYKRFLL
jgi:hypothetical protein